MMNKIITTTNERYLYYIPHTNKWSVSTNFFPPLDGKLWPGCLTKEGYTFCSPNRYDDKVLYAPLKIDGRLLRFVDFLSI